MADAFVGEIRMFGGSFAPSGWALCDGQLLAVSSNDALFSLLGTLYGGDGRTTFGLPDLRGRAPVHYGAGPGLNPVNLGSKGGVESVILNGNQLAGHTHSWMASKSAGTQQGAVGAVAGQSTTPVYRANAPAPSYANLTNNAVDSQGGGTSHQNMMPYQAISFIISLFGVYPSRT